MHELILPNFLHFKQLSVVLLTIQNRIKYCENYAENLASRQTLRARTVFCAVFRTALFSSSMAVVKYHKRKLFVSILVTCLVLFLFRTVIILSIRDLVYLLRPLWDTPPNIPEHLIPHYYSDKLSPETLCKAHGWTPRSEENLPKIIDAFIFSVELDMLEIRLKELWNVVDIFIIVEANKTFSGRAKPLYFKENFESFKWAKDKIVHFVATELVAKPSSDFQNEAMLRGYMTSFVNQVHPQKGDLIVSSDVDELPYSHTLQLLKLCEGYSREIHLDMNNYLYSFEFPLRTTNWKPHVTVYDPANYFYHHGRRGSSELLADSGWHCSFCFRYLTQFVFKMTSYSHNDRVTRQDLLRESEIQRKICDGRDIFDMLPEEYTYRELISQMGKLRKSASTVGIPQYIVENYAKFRFLLPGGCIREKEKTDASSFVIK